MARKYTLESSAQVEDVEGLDYEGSLNDEQLAVVRAPSGPMLVIAGAGSGKTHTLTYRVAWLVERGVDPSRILLLTFTNKAAKAMTGRVEGLLGGRVQQVWGGTFHSIANRILREDADKLGLSRDFTIIDTEDQATLMRACVGQAASGDSKLPKPRVLARLHSMCVNTGRSLARLLWERYPYFEGQKDELEEVFALYAVRKREMALMDFDDLLLNLKLLLDDEELRSKWAGRFEHVLVDEYQDTNHLQGEIVDALASGHGNLMVVGDDCQSIYAFRGADFSNILGFPQRYEGCRTYKLESNYRSTPEILELSNRSILFNARQFHKKMRARRGPGELPARVEMRDAMQQAEFVCQRALELERDGTSFSDMAVLYRSHHHSMEVQVEMTRRGIPFVVRSGMRFFEQAHVKDVLAYLRFVYNPRDELSFLRVAQHWKGIGSRRAAEIWAHVSAQPDPVAAAHSADLLGVLPQRAAASWERAAHVMARLGRLRLRETPGAMIDAIVEGGYEDVLRRAFENADNRLGDLNQLASYASQFEDLDRFLGEISLLTTLTGQDIKVGGGGDVEDECVTLSSIHQSKGLEWSAVFALWLSDGQFPSERSMEDPAEVEEERRLFYVATTRAKDDLYLCQPFMGTGRGRGAAFLRPSMFLAELDVPGMEEEEPWERWVIEAAARGR